jgi:hypothetical protein
MKPDRINPVPDPSVDPANPHGWPLGVRVYASKAGSGRLLRLTARKLASAPFTPALDACGEHIQVRARNTAAAIGRAVLELETGVHGIPVS